MKSPLVTANQVVVEYIKTSNELMNTFIVTLCEMRPNQYKYERLTNFSTNAVQPLSEASAEFLKMRIINEFKYAVVQFLEQPYPSFDYEYTCVPQSWIKRRRITDRKSLVAYPIESPSLIEKRVKKAEKVSKKWKFYFAIIKYETNSYEDANNYIVTNRHDASTENRCLLTTGADQKFMPSTTTEINSSSLKQIKQSNNDQKRFKECNNVELTNMCLYSSNSSESSNNELSSVMSGLSTDVSSEKLTEIMKGKNTCTEKSFYQTSDNNNSICSSSSKNNSLCLPVNSNCNQQNLSATELFNEMSSKDSVIIKSPSVKNNTVKYTSNSSSQPSSHLHENQCLQNHEDVLIKYSHLHEIFEKPEENEVISPGISSESIADNKLHTVLNPLILENQISQDFQQPQGNQLLSTYQDYLQQISLKYEMHRMIILNLQSMLPDFSTNQKYAQSSSQSTPYAVQNPINVANQFNQTPNSLSVLLPQEIPVRQSSEANCINYVSSCDNKTMYIPNTSVNTLNLVEQNNFPTQQLDINQSPVDGNYSFEDSNLQEMIIDGSTEINCIEQSVSFEQYSENESSAIQNSQNQSIECSMKISSPVNKVITDDVSSTQNVEDVNKQNFSEMDTEEELTSQIPFDQESQSVDSITNIKDLWLDRMADLFNKMNSDFLHTCKISHELHESLVQSATTFQCLGRVSENLRKLKKNKVTVETPKEVTVDVQKLAEKEQIRMKETEKFNIDMPKNKKEDNNEPKQNDDKSTDEDDNPKEDEDKVNVKVKNKNNIKKDMDKKASKKTNKYVRTFVLPPEYDPNDTKWTLKYRKPNSKLGLVELIEKSRVYISAIKLAHCKRVSKDSKTLARMLFVEIFSQNALSVCSLTGARAHVFDINGTNVRPGLDEHARMVILSFVEEHARLKGWGLFDTQSVINSVRSKIQEVRAKYNRTT